MEIEHRNFLDDNIGNWHTVQNGYVRNIDLDILKIYEGYCIRLHAIKKNKVIS